MSTFGDILSGLTIGAGQSVRRNAGNTAFEAYTPGGGMTVGSSITSGTANRFLYENSSNQLAESSSLVTNGTTVGFGAVSPDARFFVKGAGDYILRANDSSNVSRFYLNDNGNTLLKNLGSSYGAQTTIQSENGQANLLIQTLAANRAQIELQNAYYSANFGLTTSAALEFQSSGNIDFYSVGTAKYHVRAGADGAFFGKVSSPVDASARIHARDAAADQLWLEYDASNKLKITVGSSGGVTFDAVGSGAKFIFSDDVEISDGKNFILGTTSGTKFGTASTQKTGFYGASGVTQQDVTGSTGGNAALQSLLTALDALGLITDSST